MKHTLTINAAFVMAAGLALVYYFLRLGCRQLASANTTAGFKSLDRGQKTTAIVSGLLVVAGIDLLAIATPYADWSTQAIVVATVGTLMVMVGQIMLIFHLNASPHRFPFKQVAIDMVVFCAGLGILWASSAL